MGQCKRSGGGPGLLRHAGGDGELRNRAQTTLRSCDATLTNVRTVGHVDTRPGQGTAVARSELANLNRDAVFSTPGATTTCRLRSERWLGLGGFILPQLSGFNGRGGKRANFPAVQRQCNRYPSNLGGRIGTSAEQVKVAKRDRKTKHIHNHGLVSLFTSYSLDVSP